jgi:hypothetical protein
MAEDSTPDLQAIEKAIRDLMAEGMAARSRATPLAATAIAGSPAPIPGANPPVYAQKPQRQRSAIVTEARNYDLAPVARHTLKCE